MEQSEIERVMELRADVGRMLLQLKEELSRTHVDYVGQRAYQTALWMRVSLKHLAGSLPVRCCEACGLQAADAVEYGYEPAVEVCTEHPSAWM